MVCMILIDRQSANNLSLLIKLFSSRPAVITILYSGIYDFRSSTNLYSNIYYFTPKNKK